MKVCNFVLCLLTWCIVGAVLAEQHPELKTRADGVDAITAIQSSAVAAGQEKRINEIDTQLEAMRKAAPRPQKPQSNFLHVAVAEAVDIKTSAPNSGATRGQQEDLKSFRELDEDAENLLKDILDLSSDIEIVEERQRFPDKHQFLVLVSLEPTKFFDLDFIELMVDEQVVAAHHYTESEVTALLRGGGHRLYLANLPAGVHNIKATFVGKVPRDPDYQREAAFSFIAGVSRTVIELYINSSENNGFPQLTVKEWN